MEYCKKHIRRLRNILEVMSNDKNYKRIILNYMGAITIALAIPVYEIAYNRVGQYPLLITEAIFLCVLLQVVTPFVLVCLRFAFRKYGYYFDFILLFFAFCLISRSYQRYLLSEMPVYCKVWLVFLFFVVMLYLFVVYYHIVLKLFKVCSCLAPLVAGSFIVFEALWGGAYIAIPSDDVHFPPVIVVVMDELDVYRLLGADGHVDAKRYPNFSRLEASSRWFRNTTTNYAYTGYSFSSFLNGRATSVKNIYPEQSELIKKLNLYGYHSIIASGLMSCSGFNHCFARTLTNFNVHQVLYIIDNSIYYFLPSAVIERYFHYMTIGQIDTRLGHSEKIFTSIKSGNFYLFHTLITHMPPIIHADGSIIERADLFDTYKAGKSYPDLERESLQYADVWLGHLIDAMQRGKVWDRAVIAVIADHGTCNVKGCMRIAGAQGISKPIARLAFVPFFLRAPGVRSGTDDRPVQLLDLAPTLLGRVAVQKKEKNGFEGLDVISATIPLLRARQLCLPNRNPPVCFRLHDQRDAAPTQVYNLQ